MIFEVFLRVEEGAMRASKPMKLGENSQKATQNPERFRYTIFLVTFQNSVLEPHYCSDTLYIANAIGTRFKLTRPVNLTDQFSAPVR